MSIVKFKQLDTGLVSTYSGIGILLDGILDLLFAQCIWFAMVVISGRTSRIQLQDVDQAKGGCFTTAMIKLKTSYSALTSTTRFIGAICSSFQRPETRPSGSTAVNSIMTKAAPREANEK
ncbi:hypothetical protein O0I10_009724 [Lichtheimia ornata]|uniref:Uncharacterized protein n=1 Tax=Lichtheimia ornata TaxID=688661 RepID=A0AAD7UX27_9FUNG|nr:uncharacterized protein O0I10_009724 [Lichtheimia ornata]KAJ8654673.1 hypothetical protein O0I10_009724 [Lichtheimia ornata]